MGASGNTRQKPKIYDDSQNKSDSLTHNAKDYDMIVKTDLKKILFLLMQRKEYNKSDDIYKQRTFHLIKDNLKIFEQNYFLDQITDYFNSFTKNLTLKENIDWDKIINQIKEFYPNIEKNKEGKVRINHEIEYYKTKNIKYPNNFSLIESQFFSIYSSISNPKEQLKNNMAKTGYIIFINSKEKQEKIPYILLNYYNRENDDIYLGISLDNNDFKIICAKADDIFYHIKESQAKIKKNKVELEKYIIIYTFTSSNIFYLAVILKGSLYDRKENLVYELFEDVENRGIKKLVNEDGELTLVGKQNLKFCIEQDQETNRKLDEKNNDDINDYMKQKKNKEMAKFNLINNELNDIQDNVKESMKNMLTNVNEMQDLDNKSAQIKDISIQFQKDSTILERKMRYRKYIHRAMIICLAIVVLIAILYFIFK